MTKAYNEDCVTGMKRYADGHFDLAIVDPPYGIKESSFRANPSKCATKKVKYNTNIWKQMPPDKEYFDELFRVSKNQIIWGGNYFIENLKNTRHYIVWDKVTQESNFADCEFAWTSFDKSAVIFKYMWNGMLQGDMKNKEIRIHPTQKPIKLYSWILHNYAKEGDKILDTHLGSGSSRIAAYLGGFDFTGFEIDKEYFDDQEKRYKQYISQLRIAL